MAESEHLSSEIKQLSGVNSIRTVRPVSRDGDNNDLIHVLYIYILHTDVCASAYLLYKSVQQHMSKDTWKHWQLVFASAYKAAVAFDHMQFDKWKTKQSQTKQSKIISLNLLV